MPEIDIFLSPLKPPTKASVSAEAINASLYYLHVATPEDDALLQEVELEREEQAQRRREALEAASGDDPAQRDFLRLNNVRRKPVGGTESVQDNPPAPAPESAEPPPLPRRPLPMPQVSAENMSFAGNPVANVQPAVAPEPGKTPVEPVTKSAIPRRPLPPLPASEEPFRAQPPEDARSRSQNRWSAFPGPGPFPAGGFRVLEDGPPSGRHSLDSTDLIFHLAHGMAEEGHPGGVLGGARGNLLHDNDERQNHLVIPVPGFISRLSGGILRRARNGTSQPSLRRGWIATRSTLRYQRLDIIDSSDLTMPSRSPT